MKLPMFYHKKESKSSILTKYFLFWGGLISMVIIFILLLGRSDIKIPQKDIVVTIDIKDKVNICLPDEKSE